MKCNLILWFNIKKGKIIMKKIKIGLIGLGTVGSGVFKTLYDNENIEIAKIAVRDLSKDRGIENLDKSLLTDDAFEVVNDPEIDIVVEVMGGIHPALELIVTALKNGKHIVCANKELLAKHGTEIFTLARANNRVILYEAAIAGGIPIVMPLKTVLSGNKINKITAILNGTTNYILTKMEREQSSYDDVLLEAQKSGYAETNPKGDVEGFDAAYKIVTLATLALGKKIDLSKVYIEGITKIRPEDMENAKEFGYRIKLIALAQITKDNKADVRVHPMLISENHPLSSINYVTNAVMISGYPVGEIMLSGAGAGEFPTASSVIGDILTLSSELGKSSIPLPIMRCNHEEIADMLDIKDTVNRYYLSINAKNAFGVIESLGRIFARNKISISNLLQKGLQKDNTANIVLITEDACEKDMQKALEELNNEACVNRTDSLIRLGD